MSNLPAQVRIPEISVSLFAAGGSTYGITIDNEPIGHGQLRCINRALQPIPESIGAGQDSPKSALRISFLVDIVNNILAETTYAFADALDLIVWLLPQRRSVTELGANHLRTRAELSSLRLGDGPLCGGRPIRV